MHSSITSQLREVKNEKESKIMKKVFALALTVLMVMSMFAGCGSSNTTKTTTEAPAATAAETTAAATTAAETAAAELTDGDKQAVIQGSRLKVVVEKAPFRIMVYDKDGSLLHADIPDLAYREDSNHRRMHTSQMKPTTASMALAKNPARSTRLKST